MVGVFVTFRHDDGVDAASRESPREPRNASAACPATLETSSEAFTVDEAAGETTNFYVWDDEAAARAIFDDDLKARVTGLYGVPPSIRFVQIAELVDNAR